MEKQLENYRRLRELVVRLFDAGIEIACHWPCTDIAKANTEAFAVFVNSLNALCRSVTCIADPETMTIRAIKPRNKRASRDQETLEDEADNQGVEEEEGDEENDEGSDGLMDDDDSEVEK